MRRSPYIRIMEKHGGITMIIKAELMTAEDMSRALKRISHQIIEHNHGAQNIVLLGVKRRGLPLAQRLAKNIPNYISRSVS